jgi:hypothetical protein
LCCGFEFDFVDELGLPVSTGEVPLDDLDGCHARGQVVGQRVNRLQVAVLVVELANVGERQARDACTASSAVRWVRTCRACCPAARAAEMLAFASNREAVTRALCAAYDSTPVYPGALSILLDAPVRTI